MSRSRIVIVVLIIGLIVTVSLLVGQMEEYDKCEYNANCWYVRDLMWEEADRVVVSWDQDGNPHIAWYQKMGLIGQYDSFSDGSEQIKYLKDGEWVIEEE